MHRAWLARFAGRDDVAFALEGCTGWRYVAEEPGFGGTTEIQKEIIACSLGL